MSKEELMKQYTAEQMAEMVVEIKSVLEEKTTKCKPTEDGEILKIKCDKCREDFIAFLDDKYILCTKAELFSTREINNTLKKETERLQYENENCRKALREEREERDCQIAEYQKKIEELENHHKFSMMQIDDVLVEFLGVTHEVMDNPRDFEKVLQEVIDKGKNVADFLPTESIKVADMLINASKKRTNCMTGEEYGKNIFEKWQLRQIAKHLLIYCNTNEDE